MSKLPMAIMLVAALGLAACANPNRFGANGAGANDASRNGGGVSSGVIPGSVDDPTSMAYFNQRVGDRVLFAVDQSSLSPEARTVLDGQAQWLMTNADYMAVIEGHADEQGTREYNLALGERRANAAKNYLVGLGIQAGRINVVSYGKERPVAMGSDEQSWAQNRRAVTVTVQ